METQTVIGRIVIAAASLLLAALPAHGTAPAEPTVKLVLKFVKAKGGMDLAVRFDPESCRACTLDPKPGYSANNSRETVVALIVPRLRQLELGFTGTEGAVRRVIVEGGDVPFHVRGEHMVVQLPPLRTDAITAAEFATHIVERGMVLRFEHADPARRSGDYADGAFPHAQRAAADVLEFAQREVIRETGLGDYVDSNGLGRIQIMGFDTNNPHGHRDGPPHMHMHLRWPQNIGTQIGHYYIDEKGLLAYNVVGVKDMGTAQRRFDKGQAFTTHGPDGRAVYTHRITSQGWLELGRADAEPCLIKPEGQTGFSSGAIVQCPQQTARHISVKDDLASGTLTVTTNDVVETFRYDQDSGRLLSPAELTPPGLSVFIPAD